MNHNHSRNILISVDELAELRQKIDNFVILDASASRPEELKSTFEALGHIEGALPFVFQDVSKGAERPECKIPHRYASAHRLADYLGQRGIDNLSTIVLTSSTGMETVAQAWSILKNVLNHDTLILNGGNDAWEDAGHEIEEGAVQLPEPAEYKTNIELVHPKRVATIEHVAEPDENTILIDARPRGTFEKGSLAGAINIPYPLLFEDAYDEDDAADTTMMKSPEKIRELFQQHGLLSDTDQKELVVFCNTGRVASDFMVAARHLELNGGPKLNMRLYVDSMKGYEVAQEHLDIPVQYPEMPTAKRA